MKQFRVADINADGPRLIADVNSSAVQSRRRPGELAREDRGSRKFLIALRVDSREDELTHLVQHEQLSVDDDDPGLADFLFGVGRPLRVHPSRPAGSDCPFRFT